MWSLVANKLRVETFCRRHDIQHNDTQHNSQHKDTKHIGLIFDTQHEWHSVLSVVMLSVIMLNVVMQSVVMLNIVMQSVVVLCHYDECRGALLYTFCHCCLLHQNELKHTLIEWSISIKISYLIFLIRFSNRIRLALFYIRYLFYR